MGPLNQLKKMFAKTRVIATILVFVSTLFISVLVLLKDRFILKDRFMYSIIISSLEPLGSLVSL